MIYVVFACLGLCGGILSGLLGVGGAIIMIPLMLVVPPLFGLQALSMHQVSGLSMVQVFFACLSGVLAHRAKGKVNTKLSFGMGAAFACATFLGAVLSGYVPARTVGIVFACMATVSIPLILVRRRPKDGMVTQEEGDEDDYEVDLFKAAMASGVVGTLAGLVGAGGGFMLIPVMLFFLRIPLRVAIANSLGILFIGSTTGVIGKIIAGQVDFRLAAVLSVVSLIGAAMGARLSGMAPKRVLKGLLLALVTYSAIQTWIRFAGPQPKTPAPKPAIENDEAARSRTDETAAAKAPRAKDGRRRVGPLILREAPVFANGEEAAM